MIAALVQKDIVLFFRNQFFAFVTGLALVFYVAIYFLLPSTMDQTLSIAVYTDDPAETINLGEALEVTVFETEDDLIKAVEDGDYPAGLALPASALDAVKAGEDITLKAYYAPGTAPELRDSINSLFNMQFNALAGNISAPIPGVALTTEVLGEQTDKPIPMRDRILPTLLLAILAVETMGLATLIVEEIERGTARAILTTPLGTPQFFTSKAVMGAGLAFVQVFLLAAITGKLAHEALLVVAILLLGCLFITGIGFLMAALSRGMLAVIAWGMLALIVLVLPSLTLVFPTLGTGWMESIPTFYLVDSLNRVVNYNAGWSDVSSNLMILLVISVGTLIIGSVALRRRFV